MKLNRKWMLLVALVLSVAMATTGTLAYLTDEDADVNTMTLGKVEIVQNESQRVVNEDGTYKTDTIDGQTSYVLEEFEQDKPLLPIVGDPHKTDGITLGWDDTPVRMTQIGSYGSMQVFAGKNAVDKFVTVTNTGKSDAFVRTFVAIEIGSTDGSMIRTSYHGAWDSKEIGVITIDGNNYMVTEYSYPGAQLSDGTWRHEKGILPAGDTTYPSLAQVYLGSEADNEDVEAIDGNGNGKLDILVLSQAVQADGFEEYGAEVALNAGFGEPTATDAETGKTNIALWFGGLDADDIGSPGDKWPNNNPPSTLARVSMIDADRTLTNADGDATVVEPGRMIDTTDSKMGLDVGKIPLDVAYQVEPVKTLAEAEESEYRYWHADFVVSTNKTIPPFGIGLAGYYDAWCSLNSDKWVMLTSDTEIEADTEIRLVETLAQLSNWDITVNYEELCRYGNDGIGFLCGAVALDGHTWGSETISAELEPGTVLTVELRMYETEEPSAENGNSHNVETGEFITVGTFTYTFN